MSTFVPDVNYSDDLAKGYHEERENFRDTDATTFKVLSEIGLNDKNVLDVGCGDGIHCRTLLEMGAKKVIGLDLCEEFIRLAQEKDKDCDKIEYYVSNGGNMDIIPTNSQDIVFSNMAIHCCTDTQPVFHEINRILSKDGYAVLMFNTYEINKEYEHLYNTYCPIRLGPEDSTIIVQNIMRSEQETINHINNANLEIKQKLIVPDRFANVTNDYEFKNYVVKNPTLFVLQHK